MLFIPRGEEALHKQIALLTAAGDVRHRRRHAVPVRLRPGREAAVLRRRTSGSRRSSRTTRSALDGISLPLYVLSSFITLVVIIYTFDDMPEAGNPKAFLMLMLVLQTGMAGTFVAQDLILFFVFFEVVLLPMYFMIGVWGGEQRQYASLKFFLYTMFGSALMLVAFLALFAQTGAESFTFAVPRRAGPDASAAPCRSGSSPACSSASPSRCRCSRSTRGCPTPTPRRRRRAR